MKVDCSILPARSAARQLRAVGWVPVAGDPALPDLVRARIDARMITIAGMASALVLGPQHRTEPARDKGFHQCQAADFTSKLVVLSSKRVA